jgi:hypothetical protein
MIDKQFDSYVLVCDCCGEKSTGQFDTWEEAKDSKKEEGFISRQYTNGWMDLCPECI